MTKRLLWVIGLAVIGYVSISCCSATEPDDPAVVKEDPSFSQDIQPIFNSGCAVSGCHNAAASAGLNLSQGQAYNNLLNVESTQEPGRIRVIARDAQNSYLVIRIEGRQTVGTRMPVGGSPLSSTQIQNIRNWIDRGARNN